MAQRKILKTHQSSKNRLSNYIFYFLLLYYFAFCLVEDWVGPLRTCLKWHGSSMFLFCFWSVLFRSFIFSFIFLLLFCLLGVFFFYIIANLFAKLKLFIPESKSFQWTIILIEALFLAYPTINFNWLLQILLPHVDVILFQKVD